MEEKDIKYLSLRIAARLYGYTRDHLGLMIRQGKLKGIKLGNYYVTTDEWMVDYLKNYASPDHPAIKNKLSNKFFSNAVIKKQKNFKSNFVYSKKKNELSAIAADIPVIQLKNKGNLKSKIQSGSQLENEEDLRSKIQRELRDSLKELSKAKISAKIEKTKSDTNSYKNAPPSYYDNLSSLSNHPLTILPVRKMKNFEREEILRRISDSGGENDPE